MSMNRSKATGRHQKQGSRGHRQCLCSEGYPECTPHIGIDPTGDEAFALLLPASLQRGLLVLALGGTVRYGYKSVTAVQPYAPRASGPP